jgi:hypothetical protein|tara:strand:+ start:351 stop:737 length:387 start_codon:yes stop_codon:yes gene_type:complete
MASILRVDTLTDASSNNSIATSIIYGGATRTWVTFDGTASGATVGDSFNVSSSDDDGTGDYGINFTSNFNNANYSSTFGDGEGSATSGMRFLMDAGSTTSSQEIYGRNVSNSAADCAAASLNCNGDPA